MHPYFGMASETGKTYTFQMKLISGEQAFFGVDLQLLGFYTRYFTGIYVRVWTVDEVFSTKKAFSAGSTLLQ